MGKEGKEKKAEPGGAQPPEKEKKAEAGGAQPPEKEKKKAEAGGARPPEYDAAAAAAIAAAEQAEVAAALERENARAEAAAKKEEKKAAKEKAAKDKADEKEAAKAERLARLESERFADWHPYDTAPACKLCSKKFSLLVRHHHCRYCGHVICGDCSHDKITGTLVPEIQRYEEFNPQKPTGWGFDGKIHPKMAVRFCTKCDAGVTGLIAALRGGYLDAAKQFLKDSLNGNAYPAAQDETGKTWLHHATASGAAPVVVWALETLHCKEASVIVDKAGKTPLVVAAEGGHLNIMVYLVQHSGSHVSELMRVAGGPDLANKLFQSVLKQWTGADAKRLRWDDDGTPLLEDGDTATVPDVTSDGVAEPQPPVVGDVKAQAMPAAVPSSEPVAIVETPYDPEYGQLSPGEDSLPELAEGERHSLETLIKHVSTKRKSVLANDLVCSTE